MFQSFLGKGLCGKLILDRDLRMRKPVGLGEAKEQRHKDAKAAKGLFMYEK